MNFQALIQLPVTSFTQSPLNLKRNILIGLINSRWMRRQEKKDNGSENSKIKNQKKMNQNKTSFLKIKQIQKEEAFKSLILLKKSKSKAGNKLSKDKAQILTFSKKLFKRNLKAIRHNTKKFVEKRKESKDFKNKKREPIKTFALLCYL